MSPHLIDSTIVRAQQHAAGGKWGGGQAVIDAIIPSGTTADIPGQSIGRVQRRIDRCLYRNRDRIERFFHRLKHTSGIATRSFKTANTDLAAPHFASPRIWIKVDEAMAGSTIHAKRRGG